MRSRALCLPLILPLIVLGLMALNPTSGAACSCLEWPPPQQALQEYDGVFTARILTVDPIEPIQGDYPVGIVYTAQLLGVWKGAEGPVVTLESGDPAMCGIWFEEGREYLLYAYEVFNDVGYGPETYRVSNCYRWFHLEDAGPDLEALGEPQTVATERSSWGMLKAEYE